MRVDEHTIELASSPAFYRSASAPGVPPVYLHGLPTNSDDWLPLLQRTGGIAPDLIGFGRSGKAGNLDYTLAGLAAFVTRLLDELDLPSVSVVGHQWGAAVALELAARDPERIERLVLVDPLPLTAGHTWSGPAKTLTRPLIGELAMGAIVKPLFARRLRGASARPGTAWPDERVDAVWAAFDQGTQRAILRLYRSTPPGRYAAMSGQHPDVPVLIVRGARDPWLSASQAEACARLFARAQATEIPDAGHWPWLDSPAAVEAVAAFVE